MQCDNYVTVIHYTDSHIKYSTKIDLFTPLTLDVTWEL